MLSLLLFVAWSACTLGQSTWSVTLEDACIEEDTSHVSSDCPLPGGIGNIIRFKTILSNIGDTLSVSDSGDYHLRSGGETYGTLCVKYILSGIDDDDGGVTMNRMCMRDDTCTPPAVAAFTTCTSNVSDKQGLTQACAIQEGRDRQCQYVVIPEGKDPDQPLVVRVIVDDLNLFGLNTTFNIPLNSTLFELPNGCPTDEGSYFALAIIIILIITCCIIGCIYWCLGGGSDAREEREEREAELKQLEKDSTINKSETHLQHYSNASGVRQRQDHVTPSYEF